MADKVQFELVSPEKLLFSAAVEMAVVPGVDGDFAVLPGHAPLIALVRAGVVEIHEGDRVTARIFVAGGFADVTPASVTVLAEDAVDLGQAKAADIEIRLTAAEAELATPLSEDHRLLIEQRAQALRDLSVA